MALLRVATFNLLHGAAPADGSTDPAGLAAAVRALDADLLGIQEVDRNQER
jgi:endonuclease/exonuclease/phosphatase family metal-dependent hydrolase